tara:strand:+ start:205 stop:369 length:165 start_codon:yes stop_codon:yes gene_type:complete
VAVFSISSGLGTTTGFDVDDERSINGVERSRDRSTDYLASSWRLELVGGKAEIL